MGPTYAKEILSRPWTPTSGSGGFLPDPELTNYYAPDQNYNTMNYNNPQVTSLIQRGRQVVDLAERGRIYREMLKIMYDDPPGAIVYHPVDTRAMKSNLDGPGTGLPGGPAVAGNVVLR